MKRLKKMKKSDTKILAVVAVLIVVAAFVMFGTDIPVSTTTTTTAPTTTTTALVATTTTVVTGDACEDVCVAADYTQGTCRPACLSYEKRSDTSGSDCTDLQRCCCK